MTWLLHTCLFLFLFWGEVSPPPMGPAFLFFWGGGTHLITWHCFFWKYPSLDSQWHGRLFQTKKKCKQKSNNPTFRGGSATGWRWLHQIGPGKKTTHWGFRGLMTSWWLKKDSQNGGQICDAWRVVRIPSNKTKNSQPEYLEVQSFELYLGLYNLHSIWNR